jgi:hypothetical protein
MNISSLFWGEASGISAIASKIPLVFGRKKAAGWPAAFLS